jgi:hypothetical protein
VLKTVFIFLPYTVTVCYKIYLSLFRTRSEYVPEYICLSSYTVRICTRIYLSLFVHGQNIYQNIFVSLRTPWKYVPEYICLSSYTVRICNRVYLSLFRTRSQCVRQYICLTSVHGHIVLQNIFVSFPCTVTVCYRIYLSLFRTRSEYVPEYICLSSYMARICTRIYLSLFVHGENMYQNIFVCLRTRWEYVPKYICLSSERGYSVLENIFVSLPCTVTMC